VKIKCIIDGCNEIFETEESISVNARFICRHHPRASQVKAVGRTFRESRDLRDQDVRFQNCKFDKSFNSDWHTESYVRHKADYIFNDDDDPEDNIPSRPQNIQVLLNPED